ncbi:hypothetical protein C8Q75DRAFT_809548 [Abortiporus biennis]|nr:hypothetical protein C8Q75DRAFT_809548 [Abortiporus biennis]
MSDSSSTSTVIAKNDDSPQYQPLTESMKEDAVSYLLTFSRKKWVRKRTRLTPEEHWLPPSAFIPSTMYRRLRDEFHLIRDFDKFSEITVNWRWYEEDGMDLYNLIIALNRKYDKEHEELELMQRV